MAPVRASAGRERHVLSPVSETYRRASDGTAREYRHGGRHQWVRHVGGGDSPWTASTTRSTSPRTMPPGCALRCRNGARRGGRSVAAGRAGRQLRRERRRTGPTAPRFARRRAATSTQCLSAGAVRPGGLTLTAPPTAAKRPVAPPDCPRVRDEPAALARSTGVPCSFGATPKPVRPLKCRCNAADGLRNPRSRVDTGHHGPRSFGMRRAAAGVPPWLGGASDQTLDRPPGAALRLARAHHPTSPSSPRRRLIRLDTASAGQSRALGRWPPVGRGAGTQIICRVTDRHSWQLVGVQSVEVHTPGPWLTGRTVRPDLWPNALVATRRAAGDG